MHQCKCKLCNTANTGQNSDNNKLDQITQSCPYLAKLCREFHSAKHATAMATVTSKMPGCKLRHYACNRQTVLQYKQQTTLRIKNDTLASWHYAMQQWSTKKSLVNWIFSTGGLHQQNLWFICQWVGTDLPDSSAGWHTSNPLKEIALSTMNSLSHQLHWKRLHCGRIKSNANDYLVLCM